MSGLAHASLGRSVYQKALAEVTEGVEQPYEEAVYQRHHLGTNILRALASFNTAPNFTNGYPAKTNNAIITKSMLRGSFCVGYTGDSFAHYQIGGELPRKSPGCARWCSYLD